MKPTIFLVSCLAAAQAVPTKTLDRGGVFNWSPALATFYAAIDKQIQAARNSPLHLSPPACDLSCASMPTAPTPLPSPSPGLVLRHVAVGRGIQNYTCANASPSTRPVPIGAVAKLYNASCVAANYPDLLAMLPNLALQYPLPADSGARLEPSHIDLSGHHFFRDNTTPIFDMNTAQDQLGLAVTKKNASSLAPSDAPKGENGAGNGAVAWLYLKTTNDTIGDLQSVYRLNTAGGNPPTTCQSSPPVLSVQYAAEYWFYSQGVY